MVVSKQIDFLIMGYLKYLFVCFLKIILCRPLQIHRSLPCILSQRTMSAYCMLLSETYLSCYNDLFMSENWSEKCNKLLNCRDNFFKNKSVCSLFLLVCV